MSYRESKAKCDWCNKEIDSDRETRGFHNGDIACKDCYEALEQRVSELEKENAELKARISEE